MIFSALDVSGATLHDATGKGKPMQTPPIDYMQRTRDYYRALGYQTPYNWAHFVNVPFQPLTDFSKARVAIVTTAAPFKPGAGDQGPGAPYNAAAKFYAIYTGSSAAMPDLRISHIAIDRDHTTAKDVGSYFPLAALKRSTRIGQVASQFYGLPTNRSHRTTIEVDAPDLVARCLADQVDAALLLPNCPVCHQSCALAARALEAAGIATVIMGCAKDIIDHVGAPRFLFSDFPLGNAAGRPHDIASQDQTLSLALDLLETATAPITVQSPLTWPDPDTWKEDYANPDRLSPEDLAERRAKFDAGKLVAKSLQQTKAS